MNKQPLPLFSTNFENTLRKQNVLLPMLNPLPMRAFEFETPQNQRLSEL
jgi:hypothetical protein